MKAMRDRPHENQPLGETCGWCCLLWVVLHVDCSSPGQNLAVSSSKGLSTRVPSSCAFSLRKNIPTSSLSVLLTISNFVLGFSCSSDWLDFDKFISRDSVRENQFCSTHVRVVFMVYFLVPWLFTTLYLISLESNDRHRGSREISDASYRRVEKNTWGYGQCAWFPVFAIL